jgi:hypothetical protein
MCVCVCVVWCVCVCVVCVCGVCLACLFVYSMMKFQYKLPDNNYEIRTFVIVLMQSLPLVSILSRIKPIYTLHFPVHFNIILPSITSVFQEIVLPSDFRRKGFMLLLYFSNFGRKTPTLFYNLIFPFYYYTSTFTYTNFATISYCTTIFYNFVL